MQKKWQEELWFLTISPLKFCSSCLSSRKFFEYVHVIGIRRTDCVYIPHFHAATFPSTINHCENKKMATPSLDRHAFTSSLSDPEQDLKNKTTLNDMEHEEVDQDAKSKYKTHN